ncbi:hypothetical protein ACWCV9_04295 [Streptomyces sp. NPDC001606]
MPTLKVVDITPAALSGNRTQDSEPSLAVNPERPNEMVATALTPDPMGGPLAPVFVSTDGGNSWVMRSIVPGGTPDLGTGDISVGFATKGGVVYAGILNGAAAVQSITRLQILRSPDVSSMAPMEILVSRDEVDQPWVVAGSVQAGDIARDRVYVTNNDLGRGPRSAAVDLSADGRAATPTTGFREDTLEQRPTAGQDGPPVRLALHPGGTVYAAYESWQRARDLGGGIVDVVFDVVVTRDDSGGIGPNAFQSLKDATDSAIGQRVATEVSERFSALMGQERLGGDLSIAVDPTNAGHVVVAWCDRVGHQPGCTLHVRHSTDHGQTWSDDLRTVTDAKNPALAVTSDAVLGLAYQQFTQGQWVTALEVTHNAWQTAVQPLVLHRARADVPVAEFLPYLGDYMRLLAVDRDLYGVFSGNNTPDMSHFPDADDVVFQRHADFAHHQLLDLDNATRVPPSIDPFFYHWAA